MMRNGLIHLNNTYSQLTQRLNKKIIGRKLIASYSFYVFVID